ncbi:hypothetical protein E4U46_003091 [Claviceps purpurea]|nr:hypothetical protein E4U46_003091 [Claviceps purpurea]
MGLPQVYGSSDPKYALTLVAVTILALFYCFQWLKPQPFRLVNGRKFGELTNVRAKKEFMFGARQLIAKGLALAPGFPFRVIGDVGEILILPPKYAHEIRNHDHLSFTQAAFKVMLDIACNPELVEPLRKEIISVLGVAGWSKHSLYQLKLMDSVLKESQRLKPIAIASMRRMTTENIKLADGTVLPKNTLTLVSAHKHWDAGSYEEPHRFDGYRFYNLRQQCSQWVVSPMVWFSIYQWLASGVVYRPHTNGVVWYGVPGGHTMGHHSVPKGEAAKPNRAKRIFFRQAV